MNNAELKALEMAIRDSMPIHDTEPIWPALAAYVAAERAQAWDEGYEAGDDDTAYAFRGSGPHEDHVNPYRAIQP